MRKKIVTFTIGALMACVTHGRAAAEESIDRVFNFTHAQTMQDRRAIATVIRTISEVQQVSGDATLTTLTLRGTLAQMSVAEWLFKKLDNDTEPQAAANEFLPSTDDDIVRVFYLTHTDGSQALQEFATLARSITDVRNLFIYTSRRALTLRGTAAQMALVDWLIKELDKPVDQRAVTQQAEFHPSSGDDIVRVFYLTHTDTPQAFQEVVTQVRSMTQVRRAFTINSQRAVAIRGTAAQVARADQLFRERDK